MHTKVDDSRFCRSEDTIVGVEIENGVMFLMKVTI